MGWLETWSKRIKISIDHNEIDLLLNDFPHLIYISEFSGMNNDDVRYVFDEVGANRKKIAVTQSDGTTQFYVEIEKWDYANKKAWLRAKVVDVSPDIDTDIYLYYDNTQPDNTIFVGDTNSVPAENVWDDDFLAVYHMRDNPDASHIRDSTRNNNDGTKFAENQPQVTTSGMINDAQKFDGLNDSIDCGAISDLDGVNAFTIEITLNADTLPFNLHRGVFARGSALQRVPWIWGTMGASSITIQFETVQGGAGDGSANTVTLVQGQDYCIVFAWDGSLVTPYVNGIAGTTDTTIGNTLATRDGNLFLGYLPAYAYWAGNEEEIRVSKICRSPSWIKATNKSERDILSVWGVEELSIVKEQEIWKIIETQLIG